MLHAARERVRRRRYAYPFKRHQERTEDSDDHQVWKSKGLGLAKPREGSSDSRIEYDSLLLLTLRPVRISFRHAARCALGVESYGAGGDREEGTTTLHIVSAYLVR